MAIESFCPFELGNGGYYGNSMVGNEGASTWVECEKCCGTGWMECPECEGEGKIWDEDGNIIGECPECNGSGEVECDECNGDGRVVVYL